VKPFFKNYLALSVSAMLVSPIFSAMAIDSVDFVPDQTFTQGVEGPVFGTDNRLYAVNFKEEGTIGVVSAQGQAELFVTLPKGSTGNGLQFDSQNNLYVADYSGHNILKIAANSQTVSVFAHNSLFNQPNDIAITASGVLFASDPNWAQSTGQLWRINTDGTSRLLEAHMGTTNGIAVSTDQTRLYVNESIQRKVWVYDLDAEHQLSNKRLFIEFDDHGLDGMRTDKSGNLYIARYGSGTVIKVSPDGKIIKTFQLKGQFPTNVALNKAQDRLYVTMQKRGAIEVVTL
jgi:sugar lactone lactonase YvrE